CRRHHRWVHQHDPEVTITARGVTWHLERQHHLGAGHAPALHTDTPHGAPPGPTGCAGQQPLPDGRPERRPLGRGAGTTPPLRSGQRDEPISASGLIADTSTDPLTDTEARDLLA